MSSFQDNEQSLTPSEKSELRLNAFLRRRLFRVGVEDPTSSVGVETLREVTGMSGDFAGDDFEGMIFGEAEAFALEEMTRYGDSGIGGLGAGIEGALERRID